MVQLTLHRDNAIKRILLTDHTSQCATVFLFILPAIASPGGTLTLGDLNVNVKIIYSDLRYFPAYSSMIARVKWVTLSSISDSDILV